MNTYITLGNFTAQGIQGVKHASERIDGARSLAAELGGEIKHVYLTMGSYDLVVISEFPDSEAAAKMALMIGATGNLRTTTLEAFPEQKYRDIASSLP